MKKLTTAVFLILLSLSSCIKDEMFLPIEAEVPEKLKIVDLQGLKLESVIVSDEVKMNVKLLSAGSYRVKIKDIGNKLVSQERITVEAGNNILKVYVNSLDNDSYTIELLDEGGNIVGLSTFVVQH
jgi:hypothetical protein